MDDLCPHLAADKKVLLQGTLVEQPVLWKGGNRTGVGRLGEHLVQQGKDSTLPKTVAAIYQFVRSTLHTDNKKVQACLNKYSIPISVVCMRHIV